MKLVCLSDTHNRLKGVIVPDGDVLIHAGDFTGRGEQWELEREFKELSKLPHKHKLITGGNHDAGLQHNPEHYRKFCADLGITLLLDESTVVDGISFYFSPVTPEFFNWYFMKKRGPELKEHWAKIPEDTQVLVTHGQPYGIHDPAYDGASVGDQDLLDRIQELNKLKIYVGGHLHSGYGTSFINGVTYINPAICTDKYEANRAPFVIDLIV